MGKGKLSKDMCTELAENLSAFLDVYSVTVICTDNYTDSSSWVDSIALPVEYDQLKKDIDAVQKVIDKLRRDGNSKKIVKTDKIDVCIHDLGNKGGRGY